MVGAVDQVQLAPLLRGEAAEEGGGMPDARVRAEWFEHLEKAFHRRVLVAARLGWRLLRRRDAFAHPPRFQNAPQHEAAEQHPEQPRYPNGEALERALHEIGQVVADLREVPPAELLVPVAVQPLDLIAYLGEVLEIELSSCHRALRPRSQSQAAAK